MNTVQEYHKAAIVALDRGELSLGTREGRAYVMQAAVYAELAKTAPVTIGPPTPPPTPPPTLESDSAVSLRSLNLAVSSFNTWPRSFRTAARLIDILGGRDLQIVNKP